MRDKVARLCCVSDIRALSCLSFFISAFMGVFVYFAQSVQTLSNNNSEQTVEYDSKATRGALITAHKK